MKNVLSSCLLFVVVSALLGTPSAAAAEPSDVALNELSCTGAGWAVNPSTQAGTRPAMPLDHYALLKTTEQLLGITTFLGHAGDPGTPSMVATFNLG